MRIKRISITIAIFLFAAILCGQAFAATVTYTHDNLNRLTKVDYGNGTTISYTYDAAGNRLTMTAVTDNDTDNDGILDSWEIDKFGNLTTANATTDYDNDDLLDIYEYANNTDPKDTDSDGDGIPDGWEVKYGLNPLVDDSNGDLDGDGITNLQEYRNGTNPNQPDPYPHIKANGSEGPFTLGTSDTLSVKVSLEAGSSMGADCDWWVVVNTPSGEWQYYDLAQRVFTPGLKITYQGPLVNLSSTEILNTSGLAVGTYTYYFGIDLNMNGTLDTGTGLLFYDSVEVIVTDTEVIVTDIPLPRIYANGSDVPVTLGTSNTLSVNISLAAGSGLGVDCDWWVAAATPSGWYYFDAGTMSWAYAGGSYTDLSFTHQGPLFDLPQREVLNMADLPIGAYKFYFAVDTNMNGLLDIDELFFDSVVVTITP